MVARFTDVDSYKPDPSIRKIVAGHGARSHGFGEPLGAEISDRFRHTVLLLGQAPNDARLAFIQGR